MTAEQMWAIFSEQNKIDAPYEAWAFCDGGEVGDKLAGLVPFDQVSERHAWLEGEGDRSLAYWREVHREAFEPDYQAAGMEERHLSRPRGCCFGD